MRYIIHVTIIIKDSAVRVLTQRPRGVIEQAIAASLRDLARRLVALVVTSRFLRPEIGPPPEPA